MSETTINNGDVSIKTEPEDTLLESESALLPKENEGLGLVIPKELRNGNHDDSDCEDIAYFTQVEVDNTRKCLENTRLIIKDFETQLDWHLQQYMALRNIFIPKSTGKDDKRDDHLSIAQLSALIANHPEGNKMFIKRKGPIPNNTKRRRNKNYDSEEEETSDFSDEDEDSEDFDEDFGEDSEDADDPKETKKKQRGRKRKADDAPEVKDEIEEEEHELIEPKIEEESDEEFEEPVVVKKPPAKRGRKPAAKTPVKKTARGKNTQNETVDLTNFKDCKVVLDRLSDGVEIKNEDIDKDDLAKMLKSKAITDIKEFKVDTEKPIVILKDDLINFDFGECKTSNVIVTFEDKEILPDFIFNNTVAKLILNDEVALVQASVFDEHLAQDKF